MRYEVQWWYTSINKWMHYGMCFTKFGARRSCCKKLMNLINADKWRIIDRKTNKVLYVFLRKEPV